MTQTIENLLALQELDIRLRDLDRQVKAIPVRKKDEEGRLAQHKQEVAAGEQALKAKQAEIKKLELETAAINDKVAKLRSQQLELKTNREFKALDSEIDTAKRGLGEIETRELVLMEELDALRGDLAARQKALAEEQSNVSADVVRLEQQGEAIEGQVQQLKSLRDTAAKGVPDPWLARYDGVFKRKDRALVRLEDGICGGCHVRLPPSVVHDCLRADQVVTCNYCGRMLY